MDFQVGSHPKPSLDEEEWRKHEEDIFSQGKVDSPESYQLFPELNLDYPMVELFKKMLPYLSV